MNFTLRIIFYGLIAFVPNSEKRGLTAIVLDSKGVGLACHTPRLILYRGVRVQSSGDTPLPWVLAKSDLSFSPLPTLGPGEHMEGLAFPTSPGIKGFPTESDDPNRDDQKSLKWVPQMANIEHAASEINGDCLRKAESCPLAARVKLEGRGTASACHFLHEEESEEGSDTLRAFVFAPSYEPALPDGARVVADALAVDFQIASSYLDILEKPISGGFPGRIVRLAPQGREIVLIVMNQPNNPGQHSLEHFLAYYRLSGASPLHIKGDRFHRRIGRTMRVTEAGSCESVFSDITFIPHNRAECDAVIFLPEPDA